MAEFRNLNLLCRICLADKENCVEIFEKTILKDDAPNIAEMIKKCTECEVEPNDEFPQKVCVECTEAIRIAYGIKCRAEQSYRKLCELYRKQIETPKLKFTAQIEKSTQTEILSYPCELCNLKYYDASDLQSHRRTEHQGSLERKCRFCNKSFELLRQLKSHLMKEHPDDYIATNLQCHICEKRFSRRDHQQRHLRKVHKIESTGSAINQLDEKDITVNDVGYETTPDGTIEQPIDCAEIARTMEDWNNDDCPATNPIMSDSESEKLKDFGSIKKDLELTKTIKEEVDLEERDSEQTNECTLENVIIKVELPNFESENEDGVVKNDTSGGSEHECFEKIKNVKSNKIKQEKKKPLIRKKRFRGVTSTDNRCEICQRVFSRQCHLRRHMQSTHTNEKPHACNHCDKRFTRSDHLKMHVLNVHEVKSHKCDMCEKAFVKSEALLRHKEVRHGDASGVYKIHECEFCKRKFSGKRYLARHRLLHTDRIFACRFCEATFKDRKQFREHERQHSSTQRNFLCSICGESFVRNDYLRVHMRRHLGEKPYKCQYCNKGFPRATDVKVHERYHTGTKPNVCQVCGKAFHRAYNLTIHMRIHTGEKPYKCDHCSKCFAQSNDLKAHIRRHTGERFKCQDCDASFLQLYGLRQHALSAHGTHIESSTGRLQKVGTLSLNTTGATSTETKNSSVVNQPCGQELNLNQQKPAELNNLNIFPAQQSNLVLVEPALHSTQQLTTPSFQTALTPSVALIYSTVPPTDYMPMK